MTAKWESLQEQRTRRKFTDTEVRSNENEYRKVVVQYLHDYHGEFEFLVQCQDRITSGMGLTVGMMRGILNCMRTDPKVTMKETANWIDHEHDYEMPARAVLVPEFGDPPPKPEPTDPVPQTYVAMPVKTTATYAIGKSPGSVVLHRVRQGKTTRPYDPFYWHHSSWKLESITDLNGQDWFMGHWSLVYDLWRQMGKRYRSVERVFHSFHLKMECGTLLSNPITDTNKRRVRTMARRSGKVEPLRDCSRCFPDG